MVGLSEHHDSVQRMIELLFASSKTVARLDVVLRGEAWDLPQDVMDIIELLPPGVYTRQGLCDQLNSAIIGHGWGGTLGTFE